MRNRLLSWRGTAQARGAVVGIDAGNVDVRVVIARMAPEHAPSAPDDAVPVLGAGVVPAQGLSRGDRHRCRAASARRSARPSRRPSVPPGIGSSARTSVCRSRSSRPARGRAARSHRAHLADRGARGEPPCRRATPRSGTRSRGTRGWRSSASCRARWPRARRSFCPRSTSSGAIVVECGAEHTSVAVFSGGTVQLLGTMPVGGDHITRDLASVLRHRPARSGATEVRDRQCPHRDAGRRGARARPGRPAHGGLRRAGRGDCRRRASIRCSDTLARWCGRSRRRRRAGGAGTARTGAVGQVVLCGGGAALSGLAPMARAALGMPVRIAGAWGFAGPAAVQSPAYASVLGLLRWRAMVQPGIAQRASSARASVHRGARVPGGNSPEFAGPAQPDRPNSVASMVARVLAVSDTGLPCGGDEHGILWVREIDPHRADWRRGRTRACLNLTSPMAARTLPR